MEHAKINPAWPNALRWFLCQELNSFTPWHFIEEPHECDFAAKAFQREDIHNRDVFVFARRQDQDSFAGLLVAEGVVTETVLYFHPVFAAGVLPTPRHWNIVWDSFNDVFDFVAKVVVPDMREWAQTEDASDL